MQKRIENVGKIEEKNIEVNENRVEEKDNQEMSVQEVENINYEDIMSKITELGNEIDKKLEFEDEVKNNVNNENEEKTFKTRNGRSGRLN